VTTNSLLEAACGRKIRAAIDSGVDVYVGSQTPAVRDLIRREVPGATVWEPSRGWLALSPKRDRLGS